MNNKFKNTFIALLAIGILVACKKDEISVEKNESTQWEIDKSIVDNDIRTRLGYDPRFEYLYLESKDTEIPMLTLQNIPLTGQNVREVAVKAVKPLSEDVRVSLNYDAAAYDKVKANYSGFSLGEPSLVKVVEATKTLAKGETVVTFTLTIDNVSSFSDKKILPLAVTVIGDKTKVTEGKDVFVAKIQAETVSVTAAATEVTKSIPLANGALSGTKTVPVTINSSVALPSGISIGLVRNDAALPAGKTLAPAQVEGTLQKTAFTSSAQDLSFELDFTKLNASKASYVLPLKWVLYDAAGNSYELPNNDILVNINVIEGILEEDSNNARGNHDDNPSGTPIDKSQISFSYAYTTQTGDAQNALDNDYESKTWFFSKPNGQNQWLYFTFSEMKTVKKIRLKISPTHGITYFSVYGLQGTDNSNAKFQGFAQFVEGGEYYTVEFRKPIPVNRILLSQFVSRRGSAAWFEIKEVDFYE